MNDSSIPRPPVKLPQIFDIFLKTARSTAAPAASTSSTPAAPAAPSAADIAKADALKTEGNNLLTAKDFQGAIDKYSAAIKLNPSSPVYFSNRAAARSQNGDHDGAIEDAQQALTLDPKFSKAYSRLGLAQFSSGRYAEAVESYEAGLKLLLRLRGSTLSTTAHMHLS